MQSSEIAHLLKMTGEEREKGFFMEININDYVKIKMKTKNERYYKMTKKGKWFYQFQNLKTLQFISLSHEEIEKKIETIYKTEQEKNAVDIIINKKRLNDLKINEKEFINLSEKKKRELMEKKEIPLPEKLELLKYNPVNIDQKKLAELSRDGANGITEAIRMTFKNFEKLDEICDKAVVRCTFCRSIEGELIMSKDGSKYVHKACLEKARKKCVEAGLIL